MTALGERAARRARSADTTRLWPLEHVMAILAQRDDDARAWVVEDTRAQRDALAAAIEAARELQAKTTSTARCLPRTSLPRYSHFDEA